MTELLWGLGIALLLLAHRLGWSKFDYFWTGYFLGSTGSLLAEHDARLLAETLLAWTAGVCFYRIIVLPHLTKASK